MTSAMLAGRTIRDSSLLARAWGWSAVTARRYAPGVGRWLARAGAQLRQLVLYLVGFGSLVVAGFLVATVLGFVVLGLSALVLEALSKPDGPEPGPRPR